MGLFSKFVLGFPLLLSGSSPFFHIRADGHHFPDSGGRTSLRLLLSPRCTQKRRHKRKDGKMHEEESTLFQSEYELFSFDFIGEIIESHSPLKLN